MSVIKLRFMKIVLLFIKERSDTLYYEADALLNEINNKLEECNNE